MRKKFFFSVLTLTLLVPIMVSAAGLVPCGGKNESVCTLCHLFVMAKTIWDYFLGFLGAVAVIMIIISGLIYIFSGTNEDFSKLSKEAMTNVAKGLLFILGAWIIVNSILYFLFVKNSSSDWDLQGNWFKLSCSTTSSQSSTSSSSSSSSN